MNNYLKKLANFTFISIASSTIFSLHLTAYAQEAAIVKQVSASTATGNRSNNLTTIQLVPGYGVNLSFVPTKEIIKKVWFDNPGIASLDADGCLSGLGRECEEEGANVLHLRSIKPINIPGLPKTNSSLLTVVTEASQGRKVYLFKVVTKPKSKQNTVRTIEIIPDSKIATSTMRSVVDSQADFNQIRRGLIVAYNQRLITKNSELWNRVANFLNKIRSGEPVAQAAQNSGISLQLVSKLQQLGITSNPNYSTNSPVKSSSI